MLLTVLHIYQSQWLHGQWLQGPDHNQSHNAKYVDRHWDHHGLNRRIFPSRSLAFAISDCYFTLAGCTREKSKELSTSIIYITFLLELPLNDTLT